MINNIHKQQLSIRELKQRVNQLESELSQLKYPELYNKIKLKQFFDT